MPSNSPVDVSGFTPEDRRRQVAAILAHAVIRLRATADRTECRKISPIHDDRLELVSKRPLSVSVGPAGGSRGPESEVNDGRDAA